MDLKKYFNFDNNSVTYGLTESLIAFYVKELKKIHNNNIIILTSNLYETNKIYNSLSQMLNNVLMFPMDDFIASKVVAISPEFELARLNTLEKLQEDKQVVVTDIMGYLKFLPDKNANNKLDLDKNKIHVYKYSKPKYNLTYKEFIDYVKTCEEIDWRSKCQK